MDETVTVTKSEWEALQARCSEAEERASIETQLRKAVTEEMRKLQRKYAAQSAAPSNGELAATRARLRYLLKSEIVRLYAIAERALLYDWCLHGGEYSLAEYAASTIPLFLNGIRAESEA